MTLIFRRSRHADRGQIANRACEAAAPREPQDIRALQEEMARQMLGPDRDGVVSTGSTTLSVPTTTPGDGSP